jgi:hypothetical protein
MGRPPDWKLVALGFTALAVLVVLMFAYACSA